MADNLVTEYTSIFGGKVEPIQFDGMNECRDFIKVYQGVKNFPIHGTTDYVAQYIQEQWPGKIPADETLINVCFLDIEVDTKGQGFPHADQANFEVDVIGVKSNQSDKRYVWSLYSSYDATKTELDIDPVNIVHTYCQTEIELLSEFLTWWNSREFSPDVVSGWNVQGFDIPYLYNRIRKVMGASKAKLMSPWGLIDTRTILNKFQKEITVYDLKGIATLDFMDVFIKFAHKYGPQENYKLDTIANTVLGTSKISYDEYSSLHELAARNPQKYIDYNIRDFDLVSEMNDVTQLLSLVYTMAYRAGCNFTDAFGTTRIWDTIIYRDLISQNIVVQPNEVKPAGEYEGAYVKEPIPGLRRWVASFDIASLYPSIIIEYNISPETLQFDKMLSTSVNVCLDGTSFPDTHCVAANGSMYSKEKQGSLPRLLEGFYAERQSIQQQLATAEALHEQVKREMVRRGI